MTMLAVSIRQPWAWAVIHAGKDVENRQVAPRVPLGWVVNDNLIISNDQVDVENRI